MLNRLFKKKKSNVKRIIDRDSSSTFKEDDKLFNKMVANNLKGKELEKNGKINEAIMLYEFNIKNNFIGNHPYNRLAIIYRKRKDYKNEIRVINHAIKVFTSSSKTSSRGDVNPKLTKFKERLVKAKQLEKTTK